MTKTADRMWEMRQRRLKEGLCARCSEPRNAETDYYCRSCADKLAEMQRHNRQQSDLPHRLPKPPTPPRVARNIRRMRRKRVTNGLCVDCGSRRGDSGTKTRCRSCAKNHANDQKRRREKGRDPDGISERMLAHWDEEMLDRLSDGQLTPVVIENGETQASR